MLSFFPAIPEDLVHNQKMSKCDVDGVSVLIVRDDTGAIFAFENNCSHADKPLEKGIWNPATRELLCPFHRAVFDVGLGGRVTVGPAVVALDVFPVEIRMHNGVETVFVGIDLED